MILIDDCGQDAGMEIVSSIADDRIRILKNDKNRGIAFSRNRGLREAKGKYIALMDDDDMAPLNRLELEREYLDANENIDVVGGRLKQIDEKDIPTSYPYQIICNPKRIRAELMFGDVVANGSAMIRKDFIDKHNLE